MATVVMEELARDIPGIGRIEFVQTAKRRDYWLTPEGAKRRQRVPSVTSILRDTWPKPQLFEWYVRLGTEAPARLAEAADRGKAAHKFVETFMTTGELLDFNAYPREWRGYLQGIARFLWDCDPRPEAVERLVIHPELGYAGRLDLIAMMDGARTLLDFKTNEKGRVYREAHVQAHAYALADARCGGEPVERIVLVGVSEAGEYTPVPGADASKLWGSVLDFYRQLQRFEREIGKGNA